jgi:ubiquitin-activating enzyme E1
VKQLTFTFPNNATTNTSFPFWLAPKWFPKPLDFATMDPTHLSFVAIGAIPQVETYKILVLN